MAEQWLSIVEYSRKFAISDMTIRRRIKTGRLHAVLKDGKYYIPVAGEHGAGAPRHQATEMRKVPEPGMDSFGDAVNQPGSTRSTARESRDAVKSHPTPHRTMVGRPAPVARETFAEYQPTTQRPHQEPGVTAGLIPTSMRMGLEESPTSLIETKALLDFCDSVLRRFSKLELRVEESFKAKMMLMETQVATKDQEINKLRQQIEDLQLLVEVLERKAP